METAVNFSFLGRIPSETRVIKSATRNRVYKWAEPATTSRVQLILYLLKILIALAQQWRC